MSFLRGALRRLLPVFAFTMVPCHAQPAAPLPARGAREVSYDRDIRPIFERSCLKCHGPEKQKGGYRLDLAPSALHSGDNYAPNIKPGDSAGSPLISFVAGLDPEVKMPSKSDPLSPHEIALLRDWIDQGARWADGESTTSDPLSWWSLRPIAATTKVPAGNPIDYFVRRRLEAQGLSPSAEADRRTLIRRMYFDLIGLPPTPGEIAAFAADDRPDAYERVVDHLLASPRYGERWARHWLDVAHYADSHGYDKDQPRPNAWPYRDYVIRAFNEDRPYSRFVEEQLAGDSLFPGSRDGAEALGFIAAGPWDLIGHAEVPESKVDGQIARNLDRDDMVATTMNTFCSLTVQCARCHNHKFDPITQEDYYSLQAVFAALDRADRKYDLEPEVATRRKTLEARRLAAEEQIGSLRSAAAASVGEPLVELDRRIAGLEKPQAGQSSKAEAFGYHSALESRANAVKWVQVDLGQPTALSRITLHACSDAFNNIGDGFGFPVRFRVEISAGETFSAAPRIIADETRSNIENPKLKAVSYPVNGQLARFVRVTATTLAPRRDDFNFALAELEAFDVTERNIAAGAEVSAADSIEAPPRWRKTNLTDGYYPGANRAGDPDELQRLRAERERMLEAALTEGQRSTQRSAEAELADAKKALAGLPSQHLVYAGGVYKGTGAFTGTGAAGGKPRQIHLLHRGDVTHPKQLVGPGTVPLGAELPSRFALPDDAAESARRAALAQWITDPRNPLTWRSIVNRVWQYHFGRGLVDSPSDFGRMGQTPSHPELLDWLAADFRDHEQSLKRLHRLIVTSATYRQSSTGNPKAEQIDSGNALLWRMNRTKLDAESLRDAVLQVAGELDLTMGGPGFQDFAIEKPEHSPHYEYEKADLRDPRMRRRSIYRFIVRSQPHPFLGALDCADPSISVDKRNETLTPLQALALLNDRFMLTMAESFSARLAKEGGTLDDEIGRGFYLGLGRAASAREREKLASYAVSFGLPNACRLILNMNEFIFID